MRLEETEDPTTLKPLLKLFHELDRLNSGKPSNLLKARKGLVAVTPDRSDGASVVKQAIALAVEEIIYRSLGGKHGARRVAQQEAAQVLAPLGYKSQTGHLVTANMIRQWRSKLGSKKPEFDLLRAVYAGLENGIPLKVGKHRGRDFATALAEWITQHPGFEMS